MQRVSGSVLLLCFSGFVVVFVPLSTSSAFLKQENNSLALNILSSTKNVDSFFCNGFIV